MQAAWRRGADAAGPAPVDAGGSRGSSTAAEPIVAIEPPRWFATTSLVAAGVVAIVGIVLVVANLAAGDPLPALASLLGAAGLAVMWVDVSRRSARSDGDELVLAQWYRTRTLHRHEVEQFAAARASFVRWDIVAEPFEGRQVRLWVTRMLPAGRSRRLAWLGELEAWRTWIGPAAPA